MVQESADSRSVNNEMHLNIQVLLQESVMSVTYFLGAASKKL